MSQLTNCRGGALTVSSWGLLVIRGYASHLIGPSNLVEAKTLTIRLLKAMFRESQQTELERFAVPGASAVPRVAGMLKPGAAAVSFHPRRGAFQVFMDLMCAQLCPWPNRASHMTMAHGAACSVFTIRVFVQLLTILSAD